MKNIMQSSHLSKLLYRTMCGRWLYMCKKSIKQTNKKQKHKQTNTPPPQKKNKHTNIQNTTNHNKTNKPNHNTTQQNKTTSNKPQQNKQTNPQHNATKQNNIKQTKQSKTKRRSKQNSKQHQTQHQSSYNMISWSWLYEIYDVFGLVSPFLNKSVGFPPICSKANSQKTRL